MVSYPRMVVTLASIVSFLLLMKKPHEKKKNDSAYWNKAISKTSRLLLKPRGVRHGQKRDTGIERRVLQIVTAQPTSSLKCKKTNPNKILGG